MDKFLEAYHLSKLSQEEVGNLNRPTTSNKTESAIKKKTKTKQKNLPTTKVQDQMDSQVNSTKHLIKS